jgi:hypothetical protein
MSTTKTVIFQLVKEELRPEILPIASDELRKLIQLYLFQTLREDYDKVEKMLKIQCEKTLELLSKYPELHFFENPSDADLIGYIQNTTEAEEPRSGGGWNYRIIEDALCVSGILKMKFVGEKASLPIKSWFKIPDWDGLRISEEIRND